MYIEQTGSSLVNNIGQQLLYKVKKNTFLNDDKFIIKELSSKDVDEWSDEDIAQGLQQLFHLLRERQTVNMMTIHCVLRALDLHFLKEFGMQGGKKQIHELNRELTRLCWDSLEINTPEATSISLSLQNAFQKQEYNQLFELLHYYSSKAEGLKPDSKKILHLWRLFLAACSLNSTAKSLETIYLQEFSLPKKQGELKEFYNHFQSVSAEYFYQINSDKSCEFYVKSLDTSNNLLERYIEKESEYNNIYKVLYEKIDQALQLR